MSWPPCSGTFSRSRTHYWILVGALCVVTQTPARADESSRTTASPQGPEIYAAIYALGSLAKNRNVNVGGDELSTTVHNGGGGGFKAGVFPAFAGYIVGIQAESFGLGHSITAPASTGSSGMQSGKGTLLAWTTMVSIVVQYPGERLKPYAGIGAGWSSSYLVDAQFTKGPVSQTGTLTDTSVAFQYLAGLRAHLTDSLFVFGEYKYFASRYHWSGSLEPSLDLRTHIIAVGVGLAF
jgi:opacity protein-like surface antigen